MSGLRGYHSRWSKLEVQNSPLYHSVTSSRLFDVSHDCYRSSTSHPRILPLSKEISLVYSKSKTVRWEEFKSTVWKTRWSVSLEHPLWQSLKGMEILGSPAVLHWKRRRMAKNRRKTKFDLTYDDTILWEPTNICQIFYFTKSRAKLPTCQRSQRLYECLRARGTSVSAKKNDGPKPIEGEDLIHASTTRAKPSLLPGSSKFTRLV